MTFSIGINSASALPGWFANPIFVANRWLHLVATMLLVGGVLFFVFVVPVATSDLKVEHQLAVFGKARWMFRKIVGWGLLAVVLTGLLSLWRMWPLLNADQNVLGNHLWLGSLPWAVAHAAVAVLAAAILIRVTATRNILGHPVAWMWVVLSLLLVTVLLASITRQIRLNIDDQQKAAPITLPLTR